MANSITIDAKEVEAGLAKLDKAMRGQMVDSAKAAVGDELLRLSQIEVPHDKGTLAGTGVSEKDGDDHVVGYNTPYAARLHEHPEYNFQSGRKGKYLADPIKENLKPFNDIFKLDLDKRLKAL